MSGLVIKGLEETVAELVQNAVRQALAEQGSKSEPSGWLDVKRAAAYLSTTEQGLRSMIQRGDIAPHRTPNGRLLFRPEELDAWVTNTNQTMEER
jgi:excisionase family DNA binding protein